MASIPNNAIPDAFELEFSMLLFAWRGETRLTLLSNEVSLNLLMFKSYVPVKKGEALTVDFQLVGQGNVRGNSQVRAVQEYNGSWQGLLEFELHPQSEGMLLHYLHQFGRHPGQTHHAQPRTRAM